MLGSYLAPPESSVTRWGVVSFRSGYFPRYPLGLPRPLQKSQLPLAKTDMYGPQLPTLMPVKSAVASEYIWVSSA